MNSAEPSLAEGSTPINPRWVIATLKTRGIIAPDLHTTSAALSKLGEKEGVEFRAKIQRLNSGCESPGDMDTIAHWAGRVRDLEIGERDSFKGAPETSRGVLSTSLTREAQVARPAKVTTDSSRAFEPSVHAYSSSGAICLELVEVHGEQVDARMEPYWTLQIEMAKALTQRKFDWERKIIFRLTKRELPLFAAVLFGNLSSLQFANHGPGGDKRLTVKDQGAHLYFDMRQGKKGISMPIGGDEIFHLGSIAMKALGRNAPHLDAQTVSALVVRAGKMYGAATAT